MSLIDRDILLRRLLRRIQQHGYYHQVDIAMVDFLTGDKKAVAIAEQYLVQPAAIYKQVERLKKQEASA